MFKPRTLFLLALMLTMLVGVGSANAQLGGEELPPGVTHDDVYRVGNQIYCDVCAGVPLSACPSVTCAAWRQEIANLLGQGYSDQAVFNYFADRYGNDVTGMPLSDSDRGLALALPLLAILVVGALIVAQVARWSRGAPDSRAMTAARSSGTHLENNRPVPDNVDPQGLRAFLKLVEDKS